MAFNPGASTTSNREDMDLIAITALVLYRKIGLLSSSKRVRINNKKAPQVWLCLDYNSTIMLVFIRKPERDNVFIYKCIRYALSWIIVRPYFQLNLQQLSVVFVNRQFSRDLFLVGS